MLYLDDADAPTLEATPLEDGWLRSGSGIVTLSAADAGLGVATFTLRRPGSDISRTVRCDASCPARATQSLSYEVDALPEGISTLSATAHDPSLTRPQRARGR